MAGVPAHHNPRGRQGGGSSTLAPVRPAAEEGHTGPSSGPRGPPHAAPCAPPAPYGREQIQRWKRATPAPPPLRRLCKHRSSTSPPGRAGRWEPRLAEQGTEGPTWKSRALRSAGTTRVVMREARPPPPSPSIQREEKSHPDSAAVATSRHSRRACAAASPAASWLSLGQDSGRGASQSAQ